jgi:hypothetical protein
VSAPSNPAPAPIAGARRWTPGIVLAAAAAAALVVTVVLVPLGGWEYYRAPLSIRGYLPQHAPLRPSGPVGRALGVAGVTLMIVMQLYTLRKKLGPNSRLGTITRWLDFHIFCGVVGPVLITLHTSFKFNGGVSVAYWSLILVMLSGFVGRYLYTRIPKSLRGRELTHAELTDQADELRRELLDSTLPVDLLLRIEAFEARAIPAAEAGTSWLGLIFGELALRWQVRALRRDLGAAGVARHILHQAADLAVARALLLRRIAYLRRTKRVFDLWHVFHRPLAVVMAVIVVLHIATAMYYGYAFGGR